MLASDLVPPFLPASMVLGLLRATYNVATGLKWANEG